MKKVIIVIGSIGILYLFASIILPNYIGVPIAANNSYHSWNENGKTASELLDESDFQSKFPKSIGIVNDFSQIFTVDQRNELSKRLYEYDVKTTRQIVIVTIDSITPYNDIQKYATDLGNEWGIGTVEKNNGLIIVMCKPERQIGIATGTGTELILTDEICKKVIEEKIIPEFKNKKYYDGIKNGVTELIERWQ